MTAPVVSAACASSSGDTIAQRGESITAVPTFMAASQPSLAVRRSIGVLMHMYIGTARARIQMHINELE